MTNVAQPAPQHPKASPKERERVARAIYAAAGWTHWPLDSRDPDSDAVDVARKYYKMADAALAVHDGVGDGREESAVFNWKRIAGSIIDTVHLTNEDDVAEKLKEQLKRYFSTSTDDGQEVEICERCGKRTTYATDGNAGGYLCEQCADAPIGDGREESAENIEERDVRFCNQKGG